MKILMLSQFFPPLIGGEEQHVRSLSAALVERGHDVTVATLAAGDLPERETVAGVDVRRISGLTTRSGALYSDEGRRHAPPFPDPGLARRLAELMRQVRPDVVHAHNWLVHSILPALRGTSIPLVLTIHDHSTVCAKKKLIIGDTLCPGPSLSRCLPCATRHYGLAKGGIVAVSLRASSIALRRAVDLFVPVSRAVAADNGLLDTELPVEVIPNFIPDELGTPKVIDDRITDSLPRDPFTLFVGAFGRYKGVDVLARAHTHTATPTVIIGYTSGEYPADEAAFPSDLIVRTNWDHDDVMAAWATSSIAVVPSTWSDPCPTVAFEAMACGKPVIASAIGGLPEIVVHGETGLLVPPGDDIALAHAICELEADPARRLRMGRAGLERLTKFRASAVVDRLDDVYTELVAQRRSAAASP